MQDLEFWVFPAFRGLSSVGLAAQGSSEQPQAEDVLCPPGSPEQQAVSASEEFVNIDRADVLFT